MHLAAFAALTGYERLLTSREGPDWKPVQCADVFKRSDCTLLTPNSALIISKFNRPQLLFRRKPKSSLTGRMRKPWNTHATMRFLRSVRMLRLARKLSCVVPNDSSYELANEEIFSPNLSESHLLPGTASRTAHPQVFHELGTVVRIANGH